MFERPIVEFDGLAALRRLPDFRHAPEAAADLHHLHDEIDGAQHVAGEIDDAVAREVAVELDRLLEGEAGAIRVYRAHEDAMPGVEQTQQGEGGAGRQFASDDNIAATPPKMGQ